MRFHRLRPLMGELTSFCGHYESISVHPRIFVFIVLVV